MTTRFSVRLRIPILREKKNFLFFNDFLAIKERGHKKKKKKEEVFFSYE